MCDAGPPRLRQSVNSCFVTLLPRVQDLACRSSSAVCVQGAIAIGNRSMPRARVLTLLRVPMMTVSCRQGGASRARGDPVAPAVHGNGSNPLPPMVVNITLTATLLGVFGAVISKRETESDSNLDNRSAWNGTKEPTLSGTRLAYLRHHFPAEMLEGKNSRLV